MSKVILPWLCGVFDFGEKKQTEEVKTTEPKTEKKAEAKKTSALNKLRSK